MEKKKVIVPTIVAVLTMIMLTVGATYAYFQITATNSFGTKSISASTAPLGSVSFTKLGDNLTMSLSATDMLQANAQTYYASGSSTPATIGVIKVTGAGKFNCSYTMTITKSSTSADKDLYTKFQAMNTKSEGQIFFTLNNETYDFNTENLFTNNVITYSGTINGITSTADVNVIANLAIVNSSTIIQTPLNDSNITLTFAVPTFSCSLIEG